MYLKTNIMNKYYLIGKWQGVWLEIHYLADNLSQAKLQAKIDYPGIENLKEVKE